MRDAAPSSADVVAGQIILNAPFAHLVLCKRIPGAGWDAARRAWVYPATARHAQLIRASIPRLTASGTFHSLLVPQTSPAPAVRPPAPQPAPVLPAGLRTKPWRHQTAAYDFCLDHIAAGRSGILLAMGMGCVSGDAELIINRRGCARRITLRELHYKFNAGHSNGRVWRPEFPSHTRSLINGEIRLNHINRVIAQGVQPVLRITLASGKSIRLTADHEIATPGGGWVAAAALAPGDHILTNGIPACRQCGCTHRITSYRYAKHVGLCRRCVGRTRKVRGGVIDKDGYVRLYGMEEHPRANKAGQVYEHIVVMERVLGRPITAAEQIHHKNRVRHDNRPENLEVLDGVAHYRHHGSHGGYLHLDGAPKVCFIPKTDTVLSIEPDGETDVYDIQMSGPGHNFVANGIIVHNCGKSMVACMLTLGLDAKRVLIACPLRVVPVWMTQFERHVSAPVVIIGLDEDAGSVADKRAVTEEKMRLAEARGVPFVCVINYDSAWREPFAQWAEKQSWDLVIADEAHRLKAPGGKASLFFKRLRPHSRVRVAMTGTPMPHGITDVYAVARFADPTIYGPSFSAFRQKYCVMGGYQKKQITGYQRLDEFEALLSRFTFRVGKEVLDLPPETHVTYHCELSAEALRVYRDLEDDFVAEVRDGRITVSNALVKLLRLQQVTGGWVKTDDGQYHRVDSAKQKLLADTLEDIGKDEPVVVFCRFHADLDAVHEACGSVGYTSLELSGRRDELKRWQDGEAQVLAAQISAGGVGVDLTRARYSAYYSLSFSLGEYDQALSRVHRPGQTRPVEHIHLVARNTVDVKILRALEKRAEVVQSILAEIKS